MNKLGVYERQKKICLENRFPKDNIGNIERVYLRKGPCREMQKDWGNQ